MNCMLIIGTFLGGLEIILITKFKIIKKAVELKLL